MPTLDRLIGLSLAAIDDATRALNAGGSAAAWEAAMTKALTTAHTAAFIAATAERLGVAPDSPLISRSRLSRAERADINAAVAKQVQYLKGFRGDLGRLSERAIAARAALYGPSFQAFYHQQRWADWEIPDRLLPGNQQCGGRCNCSGSITADNGDGTGVWTRVLGAGEVNHCTECPGIAGDHPVRRRAA